MSQLNSSKILSEKESADFLRIIESIKVTHFRDYLILKTLLKTAGRSSEVLAITPNDLNKENRSVLVTGLKGSKSREIPLDQRFFKELNLYAETRPANEPIFNIGYHRLRDLWDYYRPVKKRLHSIRHGMACRVYKKSKDIKLVQLLLGHKSINSTMVYLDFIYGQGELRRAIL